MSDASIIVRPFQKGVKPHYSFKDLSGQRFTRLYVLECVGQDKDGHYLSRCLCDCGNTTIVINTSLKIGDVKSCGCLLREHRSHSQLRHGHALKGNESPTHSSWAAARERCYGTNEQDRKYRERGILMCHGWSVFENFLSDMGERPANTTLGRIKNLGHYSCGKCSECIEKGWPMNCRWETPEQQANNRTSSLWVTYLGRTQTLAQWACEFGKTYNMVHKRFKAGWSMERILTTPSNRSHSPT